MCKYVHCSLKSQNHITSLFFSDINAAAYILMKMGPIISWGKCILSNLNVYDMVMLEHAYHRQFLINVEIIKAGSKFAGLCLEMENIFFLL